MRRIYSLQINAQNSFCNASLSMCYKEHYHVDKRSDFEYIVNEGYQSCKEVFQFRLPWDIWLPRIIPIFTWYLLIELCDSIWQEHSENHKKSFLFVRVEFIIEVLQCISWCDHICGDCKSKEQKVEDQLKLCSISRNQPLGETVSELTHQDFLAFNINDTCI